MHVHKYLIIPVIYDKEIKQNNFVGEIILSGRFLDFIYLTFVKWSLRRDRSADNYSCDRWQWK